MDPKHDTLLLQAAWCEEALGEDIMEEFLSRFEQTAVLFANGAPHSWSRERPDVSLPVMNGRPETAASSDVEFEALDLTVLSTLRTIVSDFLRVGVALISDNTSFLSLGLDSIASVGLSKRLREAGFHVPAADIIRNATLGKLARHILVKADFIPRDAEYDKLLLKLRSETASLISPGIETAFPVTVLQSGMLSQVRVFLVVSTRY
jgi:aryl carrier-like protein